eukprot:1142473-Pelagomonas_calceolata.AAC.8
MALEGANRVFQGGSYEPMRQLLHSTQPHLCGLALSKPLPSTQNSLYSTPTCTTLPFFPFRDSFH